MKDEYMKDYKPKDAPCHYQYCLNCGGHDLSFSLGEFGLCLRCWDKLRKKIPKKAEVPFGRMLLFGNNKLKL